MILSRHRQRTDFVDPDLPITPMLDMSFQLLAFFIMTFKPTPTEGQVPMSLPPVGGDSLTAVTGLLTDQPTKVTVRVSATDAGVIANISLREELAADNKDIGADVGVLLKELQKIADSDKKRRDVAAVQGRTVPPPKLTFQIGANLVQAYVVQLYDAAIQAGFTDIASVPF
jgi:biopolymer transport protein ExbD